MIKLVTGFVVAMGVVIPGDAFALWSTVLPGSGMPVQYVSNGVKFVDGVGTTGSFIGRTFSAPVGGATRASAAIVQEAASLSLAGEDVAIMATRSIPWAGVATAALAVGAAGWYGFQAGAPIAKAMGYSEFSVGPVRCTPTYGSGWQCDSGITPTVSQDWLYCKTYTGGGSTPYCNTDPQVVHNYVVGKANPGWTVATVGSCSISGSAHPLGASCTARLVGGSTIGGLISESLVQGQKCQGYVDALNPAWSNSNPQPDADGKCPSGRYAPTPDATVLDRVKQYGDPTSAPTLAPDILAKGQPIPQAEPQSITGPATKPGTPRTETTTNPDGTTSTKTVTPTTGYTYSPTSVTYNTTVSTVNIDNSTGDTTTTNTTTAPGTDPEAECSKSPDTIGCSKYGDIPTDKVTPETKTITYSAEDLGFGGSCPAPYGFDVGIGGRTAHLALDYTKACDVAPVVRYGVIALTALGCALLIVKGVSSS